MVDNFIKSDITRHNTEIWTGRVLRLGVWISAGLMVLGLMIAAFFPSTILQVSSNPSLGVLAKHILSGTVDPVTIMFAGLVFLMFTPMLRVLTAIFGFIAERDWRFVFISTIVFLMLAGEIVYSIFLKG